MTLGAYEFMPWVRRGIGAAVSGAGPPAARATVRVSIDLNQTQDAAGQTVTLYGPGDVIGVEPGAIVRREPRPGTTDFEPNYFAHVEFDRPEFPWMFTPDAPDGSNQLLPWCVLVVVEQSDATEVRPGHPLPVVTVPVAELPDLAESWAWAHAQVVAAEGTPPGAGLDGDPRLNLSRLICPRRLEPMQAYRACLVPAFDAGVAAGLRGAPDGDGPPGPAWDASGSQPVDLPVYDTWDFATGPDGDFETLVRRLEARDLPEGVGTRPMYIGRAGSGLPELDAGEQGAILPREGALRDPEAEPRAEMPEPVGTQVRTALRTLLDATTADRAGGGAGPQPLGPPLYGRWPARRHQVPDPGAAPRWLRSLNLDPRDRAAAGIGTRVVQVHQEELVQAAWEQLGEVEAANRRLRMLKLAREIASSLHRRHVSRMDDGTVLQLWGPAARRIKPSDVTLGAAAAGSAIGAGALSTRLRKVLRPTSRVRAFQAGATPVSRGPLVERLNDGAVRLEPDWSGPDGVVAAASRPDIEVGAGDDTTPLPGADGVFVRADLAASLLEVGDAPPDEPIDLAAVIAAPLPATFEFVDMIDVFAPIAVGSEVFGGDGDGGVGPVQPVPITPPVVVVDPTRSPAGRAPLLPPVLPPVAPPVFPPQPPVAPPVLPPQPPVQPPPQPPVQPPAPPAGRVVVDPVPPPVRPIPPGSLDPGFFDNVGVVFPGDAVGTPPPAADDLAPARFAAAMIASLQQLDADPPAVVAPPALDLDGTRRATLALTDPRVRAELRAADAVLVPDVVGRPDDPLDPILAAPVIPMPMVRFLADVSDDLVLPGLHLVPPETLTLAETNPRFVAAVMVGVNHEMGRELVWRRFPHDQRATVFHRFWERGPGEDDIRPIHAWPGGSELEANVLGDPEGQVVLLIRGELLRRYPGTAIYASEAAFDGQRRVLASPANEKLPILGASLDPDVTVRGFDLGVDAAVGAESPPGPAGWFFVLASQFTEPRFGMDHSAAAVSGIPSTWDDLEWGHMAQGAPLETIAHAPIGAFPPGTQRDGLTWGLDAAHQAGITLQDPMRIIVHARELLGELR